MYKAILLDRRTQETSEKQREMNNILNSIETGNWEYIKQYISDIKEKKGKKIKKEKEEEEE